MKNLSKEKVFFHVDLDAFFASVEQADNNELKSKAVIIGAKPGGRGVVSACSYEARKFGVHSAMPISIAYEKCPHGIYLPVRMSRYIEVSSQVMDILSSYTPSMLQVSVDEAFLDLTGTYRLLGEPLGVVKKIKKEVMEKTGLTLSVGIASNKFLAKMASDFNKPDGVYYVKKGEEINFINKLELRDLWGLGKKTLIRLNALGIRTIQQLSEKSESYLQGMIGQAGGSYLFNAVRGIDPGIYSSVTKSSSISNERTFREDVNEEEVLLNTLLGLSEQVVFRSLSQQKKTKTLMLKLRYSDFTTFTFQKTYQNWIISAEQAYDLIKNLFKEKWERPKAIRLIGFSLVNVLDSNGPEQTELFENEWAKKNKVEKAVFDIRKKTSRNSIVKASLMNKKSREKN